MLLTVALKLAYIASCTLVVHGITRASTFPPIPILVLTMMHLNVCFLALALARGST